MRKLFIFLQPLTKTDFRSKSNSLLGFALTDLLAILAVLGLIAIFVLPSLASTQSRSQRAICLNHLRQMGIAVSVYAMANNDTLPVARSGAVQIALNPLSATSAAALGLSQTNPASFWSCPNRPQLPVYEPAPDQWLIGYQYFGAISNWVNSSGIYPSRSPIKLSLAQPHWTMAADVVMKINGLWGGDTTATYTNIPPHHTSDSLVPQGGNQVFMDGSSQWIQFEKMYSFHSWTPSRVAYFYQDPKDLPGALIPRLPNLQGTP